MSDQLMAVSVEDFKRCSPILCGNDDDAAIEAWLMAAQAVVETGASRRLTPRVEEFQAEVTRPAQRWNLPYAPIGAVLSCEVDTEERSDYKLHAKESAPFLKFKVPLQLGQIVTIKAQTAPPDAPTLLPLKQAIILLTKEYYDAAISLGDIKIPEMSFAPGALVLQNRFCRLEPFS